MPDIQMHRTAGIMASLKKPGDFFWSYTAELGSSERQLSRLWYLNPHGRVGSVTINPTKQENGAGWNFDGDLDKPTLRPSIDETQPYNEVRDWHGFITAGVMTNA